VEELKQFQDFLPQYKITVYDGLSPERLFFFGNSESNDIIYDSERKHCDVITNIKGAMAKSMHATVVTVLMIVRTDVTRRARFVRPFLSRDSYETCTCP
jgi:hypothetical protein